MFVWPLHRKTKMFRHYNKHLPFDHKFYFVAHLNYFFKTRDSIPGGTPKRDVHRQPFHIEVSGMGLKFLVWNSFRFSAPQGLGCENNTHPVPAQFGHQPLLKALQASTSGCCTHDLRTWVNENIQTKQNLSLSTSKT